MPDLPSTICLLRTPTDTPGRAYSYHRAIWLAAVLLFLLVAFA